MSGMALIGSDSPAGAPNVARVASLATTNANSLKAGPGCLYGFLLYGTAAAAVSRFVKLYDKASAPVVGTDIPLFTIPIVSTTTLPGMAELTVDIAIPFKNGIAYAITGGVADSDTTVCVANDVHGFILWK